jgi:hypothetical protein
MSAQTNLLAIGRAAGRGTTRSERRCRPAADSPLDLRSDAFRLGSETVPRPTALPIA